MALLCQSPEKFITDYEAYEHREADCHLTEEVIERHEQLFDQTPDVLAADMGFLPRCGEVCGIGEAGGPVGDPAADAGLGRHGAEHLADVPRGNRGDDLGA